MIRLQYETNIEVMRQYALCLESAYQELFKKYWSLRNSVDASEQTQLLPKLEDQLHRLQKKFFGFGREDFKSRVNRPTSSHQKELGLHNDHEQKNTETQSDKRIEPKNLVKPSEYVCYEMLDEELQMESKSRGVEKSGSTGWDKMKNFHQESVEITITERVYTKVVHRQAKYRLREEFNTTGKEVIITAPGPVKLKPGCTYSVDFALAVVMDKYEFNLPLERQRRKMEAAGLNIDVKTFTDSAKGLPSIAKPPFSQKLNRTFSIIFALSISMRRHGSY